MRLSDLAAGLVVMAVGLAVAAYAQTFPPMPGQDIGPALFPTIIGLAFAITGAALAASGLAQRDMRWLALEAWARSPRALARVALLVASLIAYAALVDALGFLITGALLLAILLTTFGARRRSIAPLAIGVTLAIHYGFYTVLGVPLPWGVLEPIAW